jgi:hypothetical protein
MSTQAHHGGHHYKFYVVLITLVVGGIFFLLVSNGNNDVGDSITSLAVSTLGQESSEALSTVDKNTVRTIETPSSDRELDFVLTSFTGIPTVDEDNVEVEELMIVFDDPTPNIKLDDNKLELSSGSAELKLKDFIGVLQFDDEEFSLDGLAKSVDVNGVKLSTSREISVSFEGLEYSEAVAEGIQLQELELPRGDGPITVSEKLQYTLDQDALTIYSFIGKVDINKGQLNAEGVAEEISGNGALLNINLR